MGGHQIPSVGLCHAEHGFLYRGARLLLRLSQTGQRQRLCDRQKRLSFTDYLAVLYHTERGIDEQEGLDILFQIVHDYCVRGIGEFDVFRSRIDSVGIAASPLLLRKVRRAIYYLEKSDCWEPVTMLYVSISDPPRLYTIAMCYLVLLSLLILSTPCSCRVNV